MKKVFLLFAVTAFLFACGPKAAKPEAVEPEAEATEQVVDEVAPCDGEQVVAEDAPAAE